MAEPQPEKKLIAVFLEPHYAQIKKRPIKNVQEAVDYCIKKRIGIFQTYEVSPSGFPQELSPLSYVSADRAMTGREVLSLYEEQIKQLSKPKMRGYNAHDDFLRNASRYHGVTFNQLNSAPADAAFVVFRDGDKVKSVVRVKKGSTVYSPSGEQIFPADVNAPKTNPRRVPKKKSPNGHFDI